MHNFNSSMKRFNLPFCNKNRGEGVISNHLMKQFLPKLAAILHTQETC